MKSTLLAVVAAPICSFSAAESYLCAADAATGFYYNTSTNAWEVAHFKTEGRRYVLKESNGEWSWTELGESYAMPCDAPTSNGVISCHMGKSVHISTKTLRYQADMTAAFTIQERGSKFSNDTPYIEIGRCAAI